MLELDDADFRPSAKSVKAFKRVANTLWFNWMAEVKWLSKLVSWFYPLYDAEWTQCALSACIEDALVGFVGHQLLDGFEIGEAVVMRISPDTRPTLELAVRERLPIRNRERAEKLAVILVDDLFQQLREGRTILIDDGVVTFDSVLGVPQLQLMGN